MNNKLIVMHHHPDLDAIGAAWLLVRFLKNEFGDASFAFVPAGSTYKNMVVDSDPNIVHVDTGGGKFDHHDKVRAELSATVLVYRYVLKKVKDLSKDNALKSLVDFVNEIDHFGEYNWPDPTNTRYAFMLSNVITSLHALNIYSNTDVVELSFKYLDSVYQYLKDFFRSKNEIKDGYEFYSRYGRGIALESGSDSIMKLAQMMGYDLVVRKDPRTGFMKIKSAPKDGVNLYD